MLMPARVKQPTLKDVQRAIAERRDTTPGELASLGQMLQPVAGDLEAVTQRLLACLENPIARMAAYMITAGGKRMRPALVLLSGRSGDAAAHKAALVDLSTAMELVHTATLIHDDIIDRSAMRRQQPTFHERFGTERAVLMGDYLYATAFALLAGLRDPYVTGYMADICQQLLRGEFHEVDCRFNLELTEAEYLDIVRDKTACLIAASCHLGAHLAKAPAAATQRLTEFGWNLGVAFQIADDCLDLAGDEKTVGKSLRSDLDKGSLSLPLIYLAQSVGRRERRQLFAPVRQRKIDRRFLVRIARLARDAGAVARALDTAQRFARQAAEAVPSNDGVPLAATYHQLAAYTVHRLT
jgi:octaprenyl-diphosphate synthase